MVKSPKHYSNSWDVGYFIRDQQLNFHLGNAIKYVCRANHKGSKIEDLQKAIHYLENELKHSSSLSETISFRPSNPVPYSIWDTEWEGEPDYATGFDR